MKSRRPLSDFSEEIEAHIALEAERLRQDGMSDADAWAAARRKFGNATMVRERFYERTRQPWLEHFVQDFRFALRLLGRNPGFAAAAVLTLALGIGANTAIFTAVDALAFHPLHFRDAARLVVVETRKAEQPEIEPWTSRLDFDDLRKRAHSFSALAAISPVWNVVMTGRGNAEQLESLWVSDDFFPILGAGASPTGNQVLVSHEFWRRLGGNAQALNLDGGTYTIAGVLPAGFRYPGEPVAGTASDIDVWLPLAANPLYNTPRGLRFLKLVGRLRQDATEVQANDEVRRLGSALSAQFPDTNRGFDNSSRSLETQVAGRIRPMSFLLLGAVGLVLLMACTSVTNLLVVRAAKRRREVFMRIALGASRARLLVQMLIEGLLLATLGGVAGVALAAVGLRVLMAAAPATLVHGRAIALDGRALLVTAGLVLAATILAGLPPATQVLRAGIGEKLRGGSQHRLRSTLVAAQIAMALMLLTGAGLLVRSFLRLLDVNPGFDTAHVASLATQLPVSAQTPEQRTALYRIIEQHLLAVPGVQSVAAVSRLPLSGMSLGSWLWIEGHNYASEAHPDVEYRVATSSYFPTMGIPLETGRLFNDHDDGTVCLINQALARNYWPAGDAVGKRIKLGPNDQQPWITIVGVIGDIRHTGIEAGVRPEVYRPYAQSPLGSPFLAVRVAGDPAPMLSALAAAVRAVNPDMPAYNVFSMRELVRRSTAQRRFVMSLLLVFAAATLLLAAVGIYGVTAQLVAQRTREIGVRMALGATPAVALRMVMTAGVRLAVVGVAAGSLAAAALSRLMQGLLFEVSPLDPVAFTAAALMLAVVAMLSCLGPARAATRVAPMVALRDE